MLLCQFPVFVFQKSYTGNILGIGWNEARTSYFSWTQNEDRRRAEGGPGTHTRGGAPPWPCLEVVWGPGRPLTLPLHLFKTLQSLNPKSFGVFPRKVLQQSRHRRQILGDRSLCSGTLPGWGSAPKAIYITSTTVSIDFTAISIDVVVSYDEEGVVLPWGWGLYQ
jgi:hypothetical protein